MKASKIFFAVIIALTTLVSCNKESSLKNCIQGQWAIIENENSTTYHYYEFNGGFVSHNMIYGKQQLSYSKYENGTLYLAKGATVEQVWNDPYDIRDGIVVVGYAGYSKVDNDTFTLANPREGEKDVLKRISKIVQE